MYKQIRRIHLIGVGGIGMSGIASLLQRHGYEVTGSDLARGESIRQLESQGVRVFLGHHASHADGAELIVFSSAVRADNPELLAARTRGILCIPRAEMLAELMRLKSGVAIAGAHGKTTTTSMIGTILVEAGLDPTIVVGGRVESLGGANARIGAGEFMVVEADESDGSFNKLTPSIAVATNLDREHMDHYETMARLKRAFAEFLNKVPFYGLAVLCGDDPYLKVIRPKISRRTLSYGFSPQNEYRITGYESTTAGNSATVSSPHGVRRLSLHAPGKHNMLNAVAALVIADELKVPTEVSLTALAKFRGVQRRFQKRGEIRGVHFIDDYAHHPSEISATLSAARERFPGARIRVVFQPHRYSRVEDLFDRFISCFGACDGVAVTDIYSAGEQPIPGVQSSHLVESIRNLGNVDARYAETPLTGVEGWLKESAPGDVILTLGAGDLPNVYKQIF